MTGVAKAKRGEGRGEPKGEAVEDLVRLKAGGAGPKPGGGCMVALTVRGEGAAERCAAAVCQGAGDGRLMTVVRMGGEVEPEVASLWRQRTRSTASSRALPERFASLRSRSSSLSTLSSSGKASSCSTGRQSW